MSIIDTHYDDYEDPGCDFDEAAARLPEAKEYCWYCDGSGEILIDGEKIPCFDCNGTGYESEDS